MKKLDEETSYPIMFDGHVWLSATMCVCAMFAKKKKIVN